MNPVYVSAWIAATLFFVSRVDPFTIGGRWAKARRSFECIGIAVLWIHIVLAYRLAHHWSNDAALKHVAERTQEVVGIDSGIGLYVNFLTAVLWSYSAVAAPRQSLLRRGIEVYLWLMFISAAIIFARWRASIAFAALVSVVLLTRLVSRRRRAAPFDSNRKTC